MSSDFLWSEASADVHAERAAMERSKALVALSEVRGFLVKASSAEEYDDRLSLMREDVNRVLAATDLSVHEEVLASLRADFEAVLAASRKTSVSGDIGVGSDVIWTEFGVPDFHDEVFRTDSAQNGRPWRVTKVETLREYADDKYPNRYQYSEEEHLVGLAQEYVDKHPSSGLSGEPKDLEVAHLERNGNQAVLPLEALVNSSVEVGAGQGEFSFASRKTAAAPQFDGHVTSENATVGQQVVLMGSSGGAATVTEVLPGHVKVRRAGGQIGDVLDYGWEDGQSYLMTAGKEAATKTASGEWGESEWSDEGASRVETVPGREGYLVADVYPSDFEAGVWVWSIKPSYPLSEYPEIYDLGHAANMDEAKAAADTAMGGAVQSYLREASVKTASEDTFWLCEDCANEAWNRWKIAPISPAIPALAPGVLCEKCHKRVPSVFEFKGWRDYRKRTRTASASWLSAAREVVKSHQHTEVDGVILDATTANVLVQIYDGLSPENKAKFEAMPLGQAASIAWKIAG